MKTVITLIAGLMLSNSALADGFVCQSQEENLRIKVYHHTQPELGTRNVATMILSNPSISFGRKTIASFKADDAVLTNNGSHYDGSVDLRFKNSNRKGELVGPTKLGELQNVLLDVAFSYARPLPEGSEIDGRLTLVKRSGDHIELDVVCTRYLKGE